MSQPDSTPEAETARLMASATEYLKSHQNLLKTLSEITDNQPTLGMDTLEKLTLGTGAKTKPEEKKTGVAPEPGLVKISDGVRGRIGVADPVTLPVFAVVESRVNENEQRMYAFNAADSFYYTMQAGAKKRFLLREDLGKALECGEMELSFKQGRGKEDILRPGTRTSAPPPADTSSSAPPQRPRMQLTDTVDLNPSGSNLRVVDYFLVAVDGTNYSRLRIPRPAQGAPVAGFLGVGNPRTGNPPNSEKVRVTTNNREFVASGTVDLQWQGGRLLASGEPAPARRALTVEYIPELLEGTKIYKIVPDGRNLTLHVANRYLDVFNLEVKAQPAAPPSPAQSEQLQWLEKGLKSLSTSFRQTDELWSAVKDAPAGGIVYVQLGGGTHLSIKASDLQRAVRGAQGLRAGAFTNAVFARCPWHVSKDGTDEHRYSPHQTGNDAKYSGIYNRGRVPQETPEELRNVRYKADLDTAYGVVRDAGFLS